MNLKQAKHAQEMAVLNLMADGMGPFPRYEFFRSLSHFTHDRNITREMARAILRDLTDRGLAHFQRGLFTEDGEVAGSGYGITRKGLRYLCALEEVYR